MFPERGNRLLKGERTLGGKKGKSAGLRLRLRVRVIVHQRQSSRKLRKDIRIGCRGGAWALELSIFTDEPLDDALKFALLLLESVDFTLQIGEISLLTHSGGGGCLAILPLAAIALAVPALRRIRRSG